MTQNKVKNSVVGEGDIETNKYSNMTQARLKAEAREDLLCLSETWPFCGKLKVYVGALLLVWACFIADCCSIVLLWKGTFTGC